VGADDRITAVAGGWDAFATANGAPALASEAVVGRSLFDFIQGEESQRIHRLLLLAARSRAVGDTLAFPFRCDSPDMRRHMQLELVSEGDGTVEFRGTLVRAEPRPHLRLLDPAERRAPGLVITCSFCLRIRGPDEAWLDLDDAVARLGLLGAATPPRLAYGVCSPCLGALRRRLDERGGSSRDPEPSR
jgi:hypothetical protein